jgi:hypothetical protein
LKQAHYEGVFPPDRRFCEILDNAHNLPLHISVELGLIAAVVFMLASAWFLWRTWPATLARDHGFGPAHMACGIVGVVLLHSMLEYPLWYAPFQTAFLMCLCLMWADRWAAWTAGDEASAPSEGTSSPDLKGNSLPSVIFSISIATIVIAFCAYAAWDYRRISQIFIEPDQRMADYKDNTLEKIRASWLFADQVAFADLAIFPVTAENAAERLPLALQMLRQSPEPRVIENVLLGAYSLGRRDLLAWHLPRYKAAFPAEFKAWAATPTGASIVAASGR